MLGVRARGERSDLAWARTSPSRTAAARSGEDERGGAAQLVMPVRSVQGVWSRARRAGTTAPARGDSVPAVSLRSAASLDREARASGEGAAPRGEGRRGPFRPQGPPREGGSASLASAGGQASEAPQVCL